MPLPSLHFYYLNSKSVLQNGKETDQKHTLITPTTSHLNRIIQITAATLLIQPGTGCTYGPAPKSIVTFAASAFLFCKQFACQFPTALSLD